MARTIDERMKQLKDEMEALEKLKSRRIPKLGEFVICSKSPKRSGAVYISSGELNHKGSLLVSTKYEIVDGKLSLVDLGVINNWTKITNLNLMDQLELKKPVEKPEPAKSEGLQL